MKKYSDPIHNAKMMELCLDCRRPYGEHSLNLQCPKTPKGYEFKDVTFIPSGDYEEETVSTDLCATEHSNSNVKDGGKFKKP